MRFSTISSNRQDEDAQNGHPARPQARNNRRRTLWGTSRIVSSRERSWGPFSASSLSVAVIPEPSYRLLERNFGRRLGKIQLPARFAGIVMHAVIGHPHGFERNT